MKQLLSWHQKPHKDPTKRLQVNISYEHSCKNSKEKYFKTNPKHNIRLSAMIDLASAKRFRDLPRHIKQKM